MVLRDAHNLQKKDITVGISPSCHYGVSIRDMGKREDKTTTTNSLATLHLNPIEIAVGNTTTEVEEDLPRISNKNDNKVIGPVEADEKNKDSNETSSPLFSRRKQQMITDYKKRYGDNSEENKKKGISFQ